MDDIGVVSNAPRGCGMRVAGGIYLETGLDPYGRPLADFLVDPPMLMTEILMRQMGISPLGIHVVERVVDNSPTGIYDAYDVVGTQYYPNVFDDIEEVRRMGSSRRIAGNAKLQLLDGRSWHLRLHARARMTNWRELEDMLCYLVPDRIMDWREVSCPLGIYGRYGQGHGAPRVEKWGKLNPCLGLCRYMIEGGVHRVGDNKDVLQRHMPAFSYSVPRPVEDFTPEWEYGIYMRLPITRIVGVAHDDEVRMAHVQESLAGAQLPTAIVDH